MCAFWGNLVVETVVTRGTWRRKGCASAILQEADKMADKLDYDLFLDAMDHAVYEGRGYSILPDASGVEAIGAPMLKKKKSERS
jgi:GNAT superfamily N-acetyltransferase